MKNLRNTISNVLLIAFTILLTISCSGDDGKDGTNGETGTANVISTPWVQRNFSPSASSLFFSSANDIPQFTTSIIESGTILTYRKLNTEGTIQVVPLQVSTTFISIEYNIGGFFAFSSFDADAQYRHIIIPAGVNIVGRGISKPNYNKMTYQEICTMFNIPQ